MLLKSYMPREKSVTEKRKSALEVKMLKRFMFNLINTTD